MPWSLSSFALGVVQVRASQGRRGRDTGSYRDRGERREVRAWAAPSVKRLRLRGTRLADKCESCPSWTRNHASAPAHAWPHPWQSQRGHLPSQVRQSVCVPCFQREHRGNFCRDRFPAAQPAVVACCRRLPCRCGKPAELLDTRRPRLRLRSAKRSRPATDGAPGSISKAGCSGCRSRATS